MTQPKEPTSSDKRLEFLGIEAKDYVFDYYPINIQTHSDNKPTNEIASRPYLEDDKKGNMQIYYPDINDAGIVYYDTKKSYNHYCRTRYSNPELHDNIKYISPRGTGVNIFIPRNTLDKIRNGIEIPILSLFEGEIKAIYSDHFGIDCIGIGGINMFRNQKGSKELHKTIVTILQTCNTKKVVYNMDADARVVAFNFKGEPLKDYKERLLDFYKAVIGFKKAVKLYNEKVEAQNSREESESGKLPIIKAYWSHIHSDYVQDAKGMDDLYQYIGDQEAINSAYFSLANAKSYFVCKNLLRLADKDIEELFYLSESQTGLPVFFYSMFSHKIGNNLFWWGDLQLQWNESKQELEIKFHKQLNDVIRVGTKFYKKTIKSIPRKKEDGTTFIDLQPDLVESSRSNIKDDYISKLGITNPYLFIQTYDSFVTVPAHHDNYKQSYDNCFNKYMPLNYKPKKGSWETIDKLLKHLFKNDYHDLYELMLDLLYLKYHHPLVKLPVTVLYSFEKNTGKTTFLKLLAGLFGLNARYLGSKDLEDSFSEYLTANCLLLDEALIEKKKTMDMVKAWTTQTSISINEKMISRRQEQFFATLFMCTNRLDFAHLDEDENRFMVCHIPLIDKKEFDPTMEVKIEDEVPAFAYYLINEHKLKWKSSKSRFWFDQKDYTTDVQLKAKEAGGNPVLAGIRTFCEETFLEFRCTEFKLTLTMLLQKLNDMSVRTYNDARSLKTLLKEVLKMQPQKNQGFSFYQYIDSTNPNSGYELKNTVFDAKTRTYKKLVGTPYLFSIDNERLIPSDTKEDILRQIEQFNKEDGIHAESKITSFEGQAQMDFAHTIKAQRLNEIKNNKQNELPF